MARGHERLEEISIIDAWHEFRIASDGDHLPPRVVDREDGPILIHNGDLFAEAFGEPVQDLADACAIVRAIPTTECRWVYQEARRLGLGRPGQYPI